MSITVVAGRRKEKNRIAELRGRDGIGGNIS